MRHPVRAMNQRAARPSIKRIVGQIRRHKRAICEHRDALCRLRDELVMIDAYVEDAGRDLDQAINSLAHIQ